MRALAILLLLAGCSSSRQPAAQASAPAPEVKAPPARTVGTPVAAGSLRAERVVDGYIVILPRGGDPGPAIAAAQAIADARHLDATIEPTDLSRYHLVAELRPGARVTVEQSELFDDLYQRADGTEVGNETSHILERQAR